MAKRKGRNVAKGNQQRTRSASRNSERSLRPATPRSARSVTLKRVKPGYGETGFRPPRQSGMQTPRTPRRAGRGFRQVVHPTLRKKLEAISMKERLVEALLHQTTDPMTAPLVRMRTPAAGTAEGTALGKVFLNLAFNWTELDFNFLPPQFRNDDGTGRTILDDLSHFPVVLTRNVSVAAIVRVDSLSTPKKPLPLGDFVYGVYSHAVGRSIIYEAETTKHFGMNSMQYKSGANLLGDWTPGAMIESVPVVWFDGNIDPIQTSNFTVLLDVTTSITASEVELQLVLHENKNCIVAKVIDFPATGAGGTAIAGLEIPYSGYYSFNIVHRAGNATNSMRIRYIEYTGRSAYYFRHICLHDKETLQTIIRSARVNGSSVLASNIAPTLMKQGTVYVGQFPTGTAWTDTISVRSISNDNPSVVERLQWPDGYYGYVKPQGTQAGANCFAMLPAVQTEEVLAGVTNDPSLTDHAVINFDPFDFAGFISFTVVPTVAPAEVPLAATSAMNLTLTQAIEFTTRKQLFNVCVSNIPTAQFDLYQDALAALDQHFENPFHMSDIWKGIRAAAQKVVEFAEDVGKVANTVGTIAASVALAMA